ncbi:hypothetical protein GF420_14275 [candidate division GN15 bacterium]|nr:hypothetical protein [candidate division GN15 bacterium]
MNLSKIDKQLDIREIISMAWRRKWLIMLPLIVVAAIAFASSYLITPEYEAATIIQIDNEVSLIRELEAIVGEQSGTRRMSNSERREKLRSIYNEVTSRDYTQLLNDKLHLERVPWVSAETRKMLQTRPNMPVERAQIRVLQGMLKDDVTVDWAAGDQILILVESPDPLMARDIANTLGEIYIGEKVKQELYQIRSSQDFSDIQLEKYEQQLQTKIAERTNLEKEFMAIQLDESIMSESNRSEISGEIDRSAREIENLREEEKQILSRLNSAGLTNSEVALNDSSTKDELEEDLKNQLRQIGDLMIRYTWSDPQVINFKVKQNNLIASIEQENRALVNEQFADQPQGVRNDLIQLHNTRTTLDYLYSKKPYLQSALDELKSKMDLIPEYQARLNQLEREVAAATDIRDRFKRQQESSTISQALVQDMSSSKYRVVEPAKAPLAPFKPDRKQILLMGIMLGLVVGGAAAVLVELLDNSFKKVEDVEESLELPVIGVTPKIDFLKKMPS